MKLVVGKNQLVAKVEFPGVHKSGEIDQLSFRSNDRF